MGVRIREVTGVGQINPGDVVVVHTRDGVRAIAKATVLSAGTEDEEVVIDSRRNKFFSTARLASGKSWAARVWVVCDTQFVEDCWK